MKNSNKKEDDYNQAVQTCLQMIMSSCHLSSNIYKMAVDSQDCLARQVRLSAHSSNFPQVSDLKSEGFRCLWLLGE